MKPAYIMLFLSFIISSSCKGRDHQIMVAVRDTTITPKNAYSDLFLDSIKIAKFISNKKPGISASQMLRNFYNMRNFQFAWFSKEGPAQHTRAFWNLQQSHIELSKDSSLIDDNLAKRMEALLDDDTLMKQAPAEITDTELSLTLHFYKYVESAYAGKINPEELSWHIPRKKVDETELLDSLIAGQHMESWEPVNPQYNLMRSKLRDFYDLEKSGPWENISSPAKKIYKAGDTSLVISKLKERLITLKIYQSDDTSRIFNTEFIEAIKGAEKQFGYSQDGIIDAKLIASLNIPIKERIRQMLINMERMRWFPRQTSGSYILVNIPEFKLHFFENSKKVFDIDIIVGKTANRTIIFTGMLKYVVFSPYWNVPPSIVRNEILPAIRKNPNYLRANNMERTGYRDGLPEIRQRPGGDNSLGRIKFIFPNNFNIYLHDTPAKSLFRQQTRAFSHGCIRLAEPRKLADYLLRNQKEWTPDRMTRAMHAGKETWVILKDPVPVAVTYFTAWVSRDGLLNFREDIYGHDQRMAVHLFPAAKKAE